MFEQYKECLNYFLSYYPEDQRKIVKTKLQNVNGKTVAGCENIQKDQAILKRKPDIDYSGKGNDVWTGFVSCKVQGGLHDSIDWFRDQGILSSQIQLFNPAVEYASETVCEDLNVVMLYYALHAISLENRGQQWKMYKKVS